MAWLLIIFLLTATYYNPSEGVHVQKKLKPAVVVGTVYCDTCFQHDTSRNSHFIPGATVAVECSTGEGPRPRFRREAKTDEHGEFRIPLPFSVSKNVRKIEKCSVTLIKSSEPFCAVSSRAVSSSLHLKSRKQGEKNVHIFSAGFFSFKPENQPEICNQKPRTKDHTSRFGSEKTSEPSSDPNPSSFPPPLKDPPVSGNQFHLPPIPLLPSLPPLPQLPPLPSLPGLPLLPPRPKKAAAIERKTSELKNPDDFFFPITPPFFPPVIPPVLPQPPPLIPPVLPQPPPLIPPVLPQPPPSPLLPPLPPVPGLTPPPSPPPPSLPVPLPPLLPFPPPSSPGFPGIPPASEKPSP